MTDPNHPADPDLPPQPPAPPLDGECCESECGDACVWTEYYAERALYEQRLAEWKARH